MADPHDRRQPRLRRSAAAEREAERRRAFDTVEATFPAVATASPDELVQMAIHALGFDGARLAASLGLARSEGEALIRSPASVSRRHRALLAQYLEMGEDTKVAARNRSIAAKLRQSIADGDRRGDELRTP